MRAASETHHLCIDDGALAHMGGRETIQKGRNLLAGRLSPSNRLKCQHSPHRVQDGLGAERTAGSMPPPGVAIKLNTPRLDNMGHLLRLSSDCRRACAFDRKTIEQIAQHRMAANR